MRSDPDAQPDGPDADADGQESVERSGLWARARQSLRVPGVLVRLAKRDPHHIPERLTIYTVDRHADEARVWARRARDAAPESSPAILADGQRRRTISTARIDGAVAGTPFFIALVPAYIARHTLLQRSDPTAAKDDVQPGTDALTADRHGRGRSDPLSARMSGSDDRHAARPSRSEPGVPDRVATCQARRAATRPGLQRSLKRPANPRPGGRHHPLRHKPDQYCGSVTMAPSSSPSRDPPPTRSRPRDAPWPR